MTIEFSLSAAKEAKKGIERLVTTNSLEDISLSRRIVRQKLFNMYYASVFEEIEPQIKEADTEILQGNHTTAQEIVRPYILNDLRHLHKRLNQRKSRDLYKVSTTPVQQRLDLVTASILRIDQRSINFAASTGSLSIGELNKRSLDNRIYRSKIEQTTNSTPVDIYGYPIHWQLEFKLLDIESSEISGDGRRISSDTKKGMELCSRIIYTIGTKLPDEETEQDPSILKRAMSTIAELTLKFGLQGPDLESIRLSTERAYAYYQKYNDPDLLVKTNFEWIKASPKNKTLTKVLPTLTRALLKTPKKTAQAILNYLR